MLLLGTNVMGGSFDAQYRAASEAAGREISAVLTESLRSDVDMLRESIHFLPGRPDPAAESLALMALRAIYGNVWSFLFNIVLPLVGFQVLTNRRVGTVAALSIVAIFPLAVTVFTWLRTRRVDTLGALSLVFITVGIVTGFITGSARFLLIKESVFTGIFGLILLGSLLRERPLTYYFGRQFVAQGDPERMARWDGLWQYPNFRHSQRVMCAVWGCAWLADALIRIGLVFVLSVTVFMIVSQVMFFGVFIAIFMWTIAYARRQKREADLTEALRVNS